MQESLLRSQNKGKWQILIDLMRPLQKIRRVENIRKKRLRTLSFQPFQSILEKVLYKQTNKHTCIHTNIDDLAPDSVQIKGVRKEKYAD